MSAFPHHLSPRWTAAIAIATLFTACMSGQSAQKGDSGSGAGSGGKGDFTTSAGTGGSAGSLPNPDPCAQTNSCPDFPAEPLMEEGVPSDAASLFGPFDSNKLTGPEPCVLEPQLSAGGKSGAMVPANWTAPRFRFTASGDLFEIRVSADSQANDLVAYTTTPSWIMPREIWEPAAKNTAGSAMTVTIRALSQSEPMTQSGIVGDILIAPVNAGGSMVFWAVVDSNVGPDSSRLYGFSVGDEGVAEVMRPKTVAFDGVLNEEGAHLRGQYGGGKPGFEPGEVQCIGCHTSTPDGAAVVFTDDWPWNKAIASVEEGSAGDIPDYITPGARALLKMPWLGTQTMTPARFSPGDRLLVASFGARTQPFWGSSGQKDRLIWIDLETSATISDAVPMENPQQAKDDRNAAILAAEGTAWGKLTMQGETGNATLPDWSHDGERIVYVSTDDSPNGHPSYEATTADLHIVSFGEGNGGVVEPVPGASSPDVYEYYPAFTGDDSLLAFTRAPKKYATQGCPGGSCPDGPYYNRYGEIHAIPATGGSSVRLVANDPIACAGDDVSKGLINSWPKWSPNSVSVGGKTYHFLIFSSARSYPGSFDIPHGQWTPQTLDTRSSQLYMAAVVSDDETGDITTYPAVYLWHQNRVVSGQTATEVGNSNITPAWDDFKIPDVPDVPK